MAGRHGPARPARALASSVALATDLAGYAPTAHWSGIYYRGDKIGFSVGQTTPTAEGYEMREDGRLQMTLLGSSTSVRLSSRAQVDRAFALARFSFSLDPGTGATEVSGAVDGTRLQLTVRTPSGEREETRQLPEPPALSLNLPRSLAARGLAAGQTLTAAVFDPATLRNVPMTLEVRAREVVRAEGRPVPAFLVEGSFAGVKTRSWITDVGEVVREESAMGLVVVRESAGRPRRSRSRARSARTCSRPRRSYPCGPCGSTIRRWWRACACTWADSRLRRPRPRRGRPERVRRTIEVLDPRDVPAGPAGRPRALPAPGAVRRERRPRDDRRGAPAAAGATAPRLAAERLVRHVHALLEKKPTVSLPSALEVLRTKVGDCNEHTVLYVAMARSLGLPARIAVGLVYLRGAFYYHAWPEVWIDEAAGRGLWLPVDPTLDQFPADATHMRLARGGLDRQAAILGLVGHATIEV